MPGNLGCPGINHARTLLKTAEKKIFSVVFYFLLFNYSKK